MIIVTSLVDTAAFVYVMFSQNAFEKTNNLPNALSRLVIPVLSIIGDKKLKLFHELLYERLLSDSACNAPAITGSG